MTIKLIITLNEYEANSVRELKRLNYMSAIMMFFTGLLVRQGVFAEVYGYGEVFEGGTKKKDTYELSFRTMKFTP